MEITISLAAAYAELGLYADSERAWRQALAMVEKTERTASLDYAVLLANMLTLPTQTTSNKKDIQTLRRATVAPRKTDSPTDLAMVGACLANLLMRQLKYGEAETLLLDSLADFDRLRESEPQLVATVLDLLGKIRYQQGRFTESLQFHSRSLSILESALGTEHPVLIVTLNDLASSMVKANRAEEAAALYQFGFESLSDDNLLNAHKKTPKTADYARRIRILHDHGIQVNGSFVLGFDHDRKDVFAQTAQWVEENRLECATFHILTPYPATPLFRQVEAEGRLLHRDWSRYDTAHAVFRPKHMTPEELEHGYGWMYQRLFSHASIWQRRPEDWRALAPYLAMSYLYKRSNRFWHFLIRNDLVHAVWRPVMGATLWRHLRFRHALAQSPTLATSGTVITAGV